MRASSVLVVAVLMLTSVPGCADSSPTGTAKKFRAALANREFKTIETLLSSTGKKRIQDLSAFLPDRSMKKVLAAAMDRDLADVTGWTVLDWLDAVVANRNKLETKGIDMRALGADIWNEAANIKIDEPAVDGDRAVVTLSGGLDGKVIYLDMERKRGGPWLISYFRENGDPPLWDPGAELTFISVEKRARRSEAESNLTELWRAHRSYIEDHQEAAGSFDNLKFNPGPGNRYSYFLGASEPSTAVKGTGEKSPKVIIPADAEEHPLAGTPKSFVETRCRILLTREESPSRHVQPAPTGLGRVGQYDFVAAAAANIDTDPDFDCWSIATFNRVTTSGERIYANEPYLEQAD